MLNLLSILCVSLIITTFNGCCKKEVKYVKEPYEVKVPIKCKVPTARCDFNRSTDTEVISALLECVIEMKQNEKVCQ